MSYWKKRFEALEAVSNKYGIETYRKIEPAFDSAFRQIESEITLWYERLAKNNGVTMQEARQWLNANELKEFQWDVQEYIKYGRENAINQQWIKELENASAKYHISRLEALKVRTQQAVEVAFGNELDEVDAMVKKIFTNDYYHSIYEMQKGFNIGWEIGQIDERKLEKFISKPWATDGKHFSERIWNSRTQLVSELHNQLTRTCILGKPPDDAIKAISKKFNTSKNQAGRLVMTEQAYFHSVAQQEAFKELDVEEFEVVATLDNLTSEICQEMDGKHFSMKDYEPGVTAPPFHPWCRSVTVPYFDDDFDVGERAARDEDGETYYVPADMTYPEWKQAMVDGDMKNVKQKYACEDVKDKWMSKASKEYKVEDLGSYIIDRTEYVVDGHNVVFDPSNDERNIANVLGKTFGGTVQLVPRVLNPQGIKTPDYIFKNEKYDLKTVTGLSKNVLYNALKGKKNQAENFIFDISQNTLDIEDLTNQARMLFESKNREFVKRIILIKDDVVLNVFERK